MFFSNIRSQALFKFTQTCYIRRMVNINIIFSCISTLDNLALQQNSIGNFPIVDGEKALVNILSHLKLLVQLIRAVSHLVIPAGSRQVLELSALQRS